MAEAATELLEKPKTQIPQIPDRTIYTSEGRPISFVASQLIIYKAFNEPVLKEALVKRFGNELTDNTFDRITERLDWAHIHTGDTENIHPPSLTPIQNQAALYALHLRKNTADPDSNIYKETENLLQYIENPLGELVSNDKPQRLTETPKADPRYRIAVAEELLKGKLKKDLTDTEKIQIAQLAQSGELFADQIVNAILHPHQTTRSVLDTAERNLAIERSKQAASVTEKLNPPHVPTIRNTKRPGRHRMHAPSTENSGRHTATVQSGRSRGRPHAKHTK